ncbi:N-acyl homoserine lactonase family protein [Hyphococcus sp.]|uniref:N-acyl homoserine lactonase family protein n=1 Tax=Hyphococcus sp. TaxID=2038636 RepID=UPI00208386A2|nr:MAG: AttM/AiiB [Marinicaulis sp.]
MNKLLSLTASALVLTVAAACSQGDKPAAEPKEPAAVDGAVAATPAEASEHVRLYTFDCGHIEMKDLSLFTQGNEYDGRTNSASDMCFLIRHPKGDLLWDAGLPPSLHDLENGFDAGAFHVSVPTTIASQLEAIGLAVADVEYFSISHSHFDHVGAGNEFAAAKFLIDKDERAHMFRDAARADTQTFANYSALENAETVEFDGDYDVFGDGTVTILDMPGHTPGHKSLLLQLDNSGPVLLSGDLYHLQESREHRYVPKFNSNVEDTLASMDRFEQIAADTGARVVIQHVQADYDALPRLPGYLD